MIKYLLLLTFCFTLLISFLPEISNKTLNENQLEKKLYPAEDHFEMKYGELSANGLRQYDRALAKIRKYSEESSRSIGSWVVQGPGNIGARINSLEISRNGIWFLGFSEGGVYRSKDKGQNWSPVFDDISKLSIGDLESHPTQPNTIFVGTGDPNISGYPFIGDGIYKSTDGGDSWQYKGLRDARIISAVKIAPSNPNIIYAGAMGLPFEKNNDRGLYKSSDGGNTWAQKLFINDSTGVIEVVVHPNNHNIVYAATWNRIRNNKKSLVYGPDAGIYKSIDGGDSWVKLAIDLPPGDYSRVGIAMAPSDPNVLYASFVDTGLDLRHLMRTSDGGATWLPCNIDENTGLNPRVTGGFGWYFGKIGIDPDDPNDVWILAVDLWRSKDGGQTWQLATPEWWQYAVHADKHDIQFNDDKIYLATDGGAYVSEDDGANWTDIENIPTTQFYRVGYNPHQPDKYYGGAQDNGTSGGNAVTINEWERIYGGDGFQVLFDHEDPLIMYAETQNGGIVASTDGGDGFFGFTDGLDGGEPRNWDMPIVMSAINSKKLITGTNRVYMVEAGPDTIWTPISPKLTSDFTVALRKNISSLSISPHNDNHILAGTSDGQLWITVDNGTNWENITKNLPERYITSVAFSPLNPERVYVTFSGYKDNDDVPYIYFSDNKGFSWSSAAKDLPNIAINKVLILPPVNDLAYDHIFIATDGGVFYRAEYQTTWRRLGTDMPIIPVYDLVYNVANNQLVAGTYARSIQSFDLRQVEYISNTNESIENSDGIIINSIVSGDILIKEEATGLKKEYEIFDISGRKIKSGILSKSINFSELPTGVYILKANKRQAEKFVKI